MAQNYLMAQAPRYPYQLLYPAPAVPGDFSDSEDSKAPQPRSDLLTDALLFDKLNEDRQAAGPGGQPAQNPLMASGDMDSMFSPYTNPYYAQQQGQRQQQMNLKQAKDAWDMYQRYQSLFGGGTAPAASSGFMAVPGGAGYGSAAGGAAFDAGVMAVPGGLSNAAVGGGLATGAGGSAGTAFLGGTQGAGWAGSTFTPAASGGAGAAGGMGAMAGLGGLAGLGLFTILALNYQSKHADEEFYKPEAIKDRYEWGQLEQNYPEVYAAMVEDKQRAAYAHDYYNPYDAGE